LKNTHPLRQHPVSDEIDLFDLLQAIWKQKTWVAGCALVAGLLGAIYAFMSPQVYQVSSVLRPVAINELDALNRSDVYKLSPADALAKVAVQLDSYETRLAFFRANPTLLAADERSGYSQAQSAEAFNLMLFDSKGSDAGNASLRVEMQYPKGVDGVAILKGFIDYAIARQRDQVGADLTVIVNNRLAELEGKIDNARKDYAREKAAKIAQLLENDSIKRAQLQDELDALRLALRVQRTQRLAQLSEAIAIARSAGIKTPSAVGTPQASPTQVTNQASALYLMGTQALEAERAALQQRTGDDFTSERVAEIGKELHLLEANREVDALKARGDDDMFIQNVEWPRAEIARLRGLNIDMNGLKLVTIDRPAQEPLSPIKPRKALIIVVSLSAGLMLGMLLALIRHLFQTRGERTPSTH
jgi:LPS O-antigen subunit length determinant protein (WzzB/FepE family)